MLVQQALLPLLVSTAAVSASTLYQKPLGEVSVGEKEPNLPNDTEPDVSPFVFTSLQGLMRQWQNVFAPTGHTIIPGTIPAHTLLYHARRDMETPPSPEWFAFDIEMSYGIISPFGECVMNTYASTRPIKVLYFDGMSAALGGEGTLDSQNLFLYGKVVDEDWGHRMEDDEHGPRGPGSPGRPGGPLYGEYKRARELCKWANSLGEGVIEGFVRMNSGFELLWCDFESESIELVSRLNVTIPTSKKATEIFEFEEEFEELNGEEEFEEINGDFEGSEGEYEHHCPPPPPPCGHEGDHHHNNPPPPDCHHGPPKEGHLPSHKDRRRRPPSGGGHPPPDCHHPPPPHFSHGDHPPHGPPKEECPHHPPPHCHHPHGPPPRSRWRSIIRKFLGRLLPGHRHDGDHGHHSPCRPPKGEHPHPQWHKSPPGRHHPPPGHGGKPGCHHPPPHHCHPPPPHHCPPHHCPPHHCPPHHCPPHHCPPHHCPPHKPPPHKPPPHKPPPPEYPPPYGEPPNASHPHHPPGQQSPFALESRWEWVRSATWHYTSPEERVKLDYCRMTSYYNVSHPTGAKRSHRLTAVTPEQAEAVKTEVEHNLLSEDVYCTGIDWREVADGISRRYLERIMELRGLLNTRPSPEMVKKARGLGHAIIIPFLQISDESTEAAMERCVKEYTGRIELSRIGNSERMLVGSVEGIMEGICKVAFGVYQGFSGPVDREIVVKAREDVEGLVSWVDWAGWHRCEETCGWDEVCAVPLWPILGTPWKKGADDELLSRPRCVSIEFMEIGNGGWGPGRPPN